MLSELRELFTGKEVRRDFKNQTLKVSGWLLAAIVAAVVIYGLNLH